MAEERSLAIVADHPIDGELANKGLLTLNVEDFYEPRTLFTVSPELAREVISDMRDATIFDGEMFDAILVLQESEDGVEGTAICSDAGYVVYEETFSPDKPINEVVEALIVGFENHCY